MCRHRPVIATLFVGALVLVAGFGAAGAQQATGVNPTRDCQVLRTCNFARNGAFRGCLSSYTCRTCRLVKARCSIGPTGGRGRCEEMVCSWGG